MKRGRVLAPGRKPKSGNKLEGAAAATTISVMNIDLRHLFASTHRLLAQCGVCHLQHGAADEEIYFDTLPIALRSNFMVAVN